MRTWERKQRGRRCRVAALLRIELISAVFRALEAMEKIPGESNSVDAAE
jgi:hypothetical protein